MPTAKSKLHNYLQQHEGPPEINPHGMGSPPRPLIATAAAGGAISAPSPLGLKHDKKALLESLKIPMKTARSPRFINENGIMKPPGTPRVKPSVYQRQNDLDARVGWESEPSGSTRSESENDGIEIGLRERWEEQSNVQSLFSESEPALPAPKQVVRDEDDTQSDILVDRPRHRLSRSARKNSGSIPYIRRDRGQHKISDSVPTLGFTKDGQFGLAPPETNRFSASMITHAPRGTMPEAATYKEDPFGTTSGETSPQAPPERAVSFLHSAFPYRGNEAKSYTHVERAAYHADAARKLAPGKYDAVIDPIHPQVFANADRVHSISDSRPPIFSNIDNPLLEDPGSDESDVSSQGDEVEKHQHTPRARRTRAVPENATVVFNPQKPMLPQKPQKGAALPEQALEGSPMSRFIDQRSPSKKRRRGADYDDAALKQMSFAELQNEPFDHDPTREIPQSPAKPPADNLGDRLKFYRGKDEDIQTQFFSEMPVRDWEESGDWFLEQFGDIVRRMKEARQAKRNMVEQYETEISNREEVVRRKKENIDRKLSKLRHDGDEMMKGKELDD